MEQFNHFDSKDLVNSDYYNQANDSIEFETSVKMELLSSRHNIKTVRPPKYEKKLKKFQFLRLY